MLAYGLINAVAFSTNTAGRCNHLCNLTLA